MKVTPHVAHFLDAAHHHLADRADELCPAKALLDELALLLRDAITVSIGCRWILSRAIGRQSWLALPKTEPSPKKRRCGRWVFQQLVKA
jgi:hypothetical protein